MLLDYDDQMDELLARGGSFDITGTDAVIHKQFWGFNASEGAVLDTLKGVPIKSSLANWAAITAAEVDLKALVITGAADPLFGNVIYRVDGYVITNIKLTSGSLHCFKLRNQVSS